MTASGATPLSASTAGAFAGLISTAVFAACTHSLWGSVLIVQLMSFISLLFWTEKLEKSFSCKRFPKAYGSFERYTCGSQSGRQGDGHEHDDGAVVGGAARYYTAAGRSPDGYTTPAVAVSTPTSSTSPSCKARSSKHLAAQPR